MKLDGRQDSGWNGPPECASDLTQEVKNKWFDVWISSVDPLHTIGHQKVVLWHWPL